MRRPVRSVPLSLLGSLSRLNGFLHDARRALTSATKEASQLERLLEWQDIERTYTPAERQLDVRLDRRCVPA